jgi:hypothetical protein
MKYFLYLVNPQKHKIMKRTALLLPLIVATMISCNNTSNENNTPASDSAAVAAAPAKEEAPPPPLDSATKMKKMIEYGTPGDMHKMLAESNGKWAADVSSWDAADKPPTKFAGVAENKMIMNSLYQQSTFKADMGGMPFEGVSNTGYDNVRKVFVSTWFDNMSSGMMYMEGTYDAATKTMTLNGKMTDCTTDKEGPIRQVIKFIDDKTQVMEMFANGPDGKEMKMMEIKYTKK